MYMRFLVEGGHALKGEVTISGSKNAALPILAATLLADEPCVIKNVPDIEDVATMIELLRLLGKGIDFGNNTITVWKSRIFPAKLPDKLICKMRGSVVLLGPMLARFGKADITLPGGCILGTRPFDTHIDAFSKLGIENLSTKDRLRFRARQKLSGKKIILRELSVTATENIILLSALIPGTTEIEVAAAEPHVQDLCRFLQKMGVLIEGIGTHSLKISGARKLKGAIHSVTSDYLEAGVFAIAAAVTKGRVLIKNFDPNHLCAFWNLLEEIGVEFKIEKSQTLVEGKGIFRACKELKTAVYPGFPTDLQAPFAVLLSQCRGKSVVHETLFEKRLNYLSQLQKMGAKTEILNNHQAIIEGLTPLRAAKIVSPDIRAGAAMVLAALIAKGKSEIIGIDYIKRGFERFDEKLRNLGAKITALEA